MPHSKTDRQAEPETVHMRTLTRSHSFTRVPFRSRCRLQDAVNNMRAKLKKQELQIQSENISLTEVGVYKEAKHTNTNARTQTQTQAQTQTHTHKHTHTNTDKRSLDADTHRKDDRHSLPCGVELNIGHALRKHPNTWQ